MIIKSINYKSKLYTFIIGIDNLLWYKIFDENKWNTWKTIIDSNSIITDFALLTIGDKLNIIIKTNTDNIISITFNGLIWSEWIQLKTFVKEFDAKLNYIITQDIDNSTWIGSWIGISWNWQNLNIVSIKKPTLELYNGKIYVIIVTTDASLWYNIYDGYLWSGWITQGGNLNSIINTNVYNNLLYVFGLGIDNNIYYKTFNGIIWTEWQTLGGYIISDIKSDIYANNLYIFGEGIDNNIWYRTLINDWQNFNKNISSNIETYVFNNKLYIFGIGIDNKIWYNSFDGSTWDIWIDIDSKIAMSCTFDYVELFNKCYPINYIKYSAMALIILALLRK